MKNTTYNPLTTGNFKKKLAATSPGNPYEKRMVYDSALGFKIKEIDPSHWNGWRTYILRGEVNDGNAWYANGEYQVLRDYFQLSTIFRRWSKHAD